MPKRATQRTVSLVTRRPDGGGIWYENFTVNGRRFRRSLATHDKTEAEIIAAQRRAEALLGRLRDDGKSEITLSKALGRYWLEIGQFAATADEIARHGRTLMAGIGGDTLLSEINFSRLSAFVASRRVREARDPQTRKKILVDRANGSVNREIGHLRTVMLAAGRWDNDVARIDWRRLLLDEPENVQTILSEAREAEFFAELRPDYHALVLFALATGVRLENAIGLTWGQIDWQAKRITFRTKSRKPGKKLLVLPLTAELAAIIGAERARGTALYNEVHHRGTGPDDPQAVVFTYLCRRNRHDPHSGVLQQKGERYPFTHDGWRKEWDRARCAIGLPELRFHDLRHTAAARALRAAGGNLKVVQRMLGHADVSTTLRYLPGEVEDLAAAMDGMRQRLPTSVPGREAK